MPLRKPCHFCRIDLSDTLMPGGYDAETYRGYYLEMEPDSSFRPYIFGNWAEKFSIYVPHSDGYGRVIIKDIRYCPKCGRKLRMPKNDV